MYARTHTQASPASQSTLIEPPVVEVQQQPVDSESVIRRPAVQQQPVESESVIRKPAVRKRPPQPDLKQWCLNNTWILAIAAIIIGGGTLTFFMSRTTESDTTVGRIPLGVAPSPPVETLDNKQAVARQAESAQLRATDVAFQSAAEQLQLLMAFRARRHRDDAQAQYNAEIDRANKEGRRAIYASPLEVLIGSATRQAEDLKAASRSRSSHETIIATIEAMSVLAAVKAELSIDKGKGFPLDLAVNPFDPSQVPAPEVLASYMTAWVDAQRVAIATKASAQDALMREPLNPPSDQNVSSNQQPVAMP